MELEMAARTKPRPSMTAPARETDAIRILPAPIICGWWPISATGLPVSTISVKFHNTLIRLLADLCDREFRGCSAI